MYFFFQFIKSYCTNFYRCINLRSYQLWCFFMSDKVLVFHLQHFYYKIQCLHSQIQANLFEYQLDMWSLYFLYKINRRSQGRNIKTKHIFCHFLIILENIIFKMSQQKLSTWLIAMVMFEACSRIELRWEFVRSWIRPV